MQAFLLVFLGGGLGSFARYATTNWAITLWGPAFPYGTMLVNLVGCLLIGLVAGLPQAANSLSNPTRLLLVSGFLGGFTTFSSYEYESFMLTTKHAIAPALLNLMLSVVLGFLAVGLGYGITRYGLGFR